MRGAQRLRSIWGEIRHHAKADDFQWMRTYFVAAKPHTALPRTIGQVQIPWTCPCCWCMQLDVRMSRQAQRNTQDFEA